MSALLTVTMKASVSLTSSILHRNLISHEVALICRVAAVVAEVVVLLLSCIRTRDMCHRYSIISIILAPEKLPMVIVQSGQFPHKMGFRESYTHRCNHQAYCTFRESRSQSYVLIPVMRYDSICIRILLSMQVAQLILSPHNLLDGIPAMYGPPLVFEPAVLTYQHSG